MVLWYNGYGKEGGEMNQLEKKEKKNDNLLIVLFSIVGVVVSVFSFLIYHNSKHFLVITGVCIVDVIYAYFNASLFFKAKEWRGVRQILIPLMMIVYWCAVLAIVFIGGAVLVDGVFSNQFLLYPIFLMPAFVLEILIFALVASGL